jgi:hypothetical protein
MNATVVTADGRLARLVLFRTEVLSEQDYECQPRNQLTLAEVQKLAKALGPPPATKPRSHPSREQPDTRLSVLSI